MKHISSCARRGHLALLVINMSPTNPLRNATVHGSAPANIITTNISRLRYRFHEKYTFFRLQLSCHFYPFEHFSFVPDSLLFTFLNIKLHATPVGDELRCVADISTYDKCHLISVRS